MKNSTIGLIVCTAVAGIVLWYVLYGRRKPPPPASPVAPPPVPAKDEETEIDCADPTFDPRCTILYKLLRGTVGQSVSGVEGCSREIAAKATSDPFEVYAIEERIDGNSVQTMFYERVHNQSQEFLITISADNNVVEDVVAVDKMLKPTETLAANAEAIGEEYSKFISPLEPDDDVVHG
jgi:hypothetical protein